MAPKRAKTSKNLKKTAKIFFLYVRFYWGGKNFINKKDLFYAKFFEFEEFSIAPFFCISIQPQHAVASSSTMLKSRDLSHVIYKVLAYHIACHKTYQLNISTRNLKFGYQSANLVV